MRLPDAQKIPTAPLVAAGLLGGYLVARTTKNRPLGGAVLAAAGTAAGRTWLSKTGAIPTAVLAGVYLGAFGASHPLAKKIGAWPSVFAATGVSTLAALFVADLRR